MWCLTVHVAFRASTGMYMTVGKKPGENPRKKRTIKTWLQKKYNTLEAQNNEFKCQLISIVKILSRGSWVVGCGSWVVGRGLWVLVGVILISGVVI